MKLDLRYLYLLLAIALLLSSCLSTQSTIPTQTQILILTFTSVPSSFTVTPTSTQTATPTPPATLNPEQAKSVIRALLQTPEDCQVPCFWHIVPGKTAFDEAKNIFAHLGLTLKSTTSEGNKKIYSAVYETENGLQIIPILKVQDGIVTDLRIDIHPEPQKTGALREWLNYSPETLIGQYGSPSRVDFFVGRGPNPSYSMSMYFDSVKLLTRYVSYDLGSHLQACPINGQMDSVNVWLDQSLYAPPSDWVPLEQATSLTMDEFSKLMTDDPRKACFHLKEQKFP